MFTPKNDTCGRTTGSVEVTKLRYMTFALSEPAADWCEGAALILGATYKIPAPEHRQAQGHKSHSGKKRPRILDRKRRGQGER